MHVVCIMLGDKVLDGLRMIYSGVRVDCVMALRAVRCVACRVRCVRAALRVE